MLNKKREMRNALKDKKVVEKKYSGACRNKNKIKF